MKLIKLHKRLGYINNLLWGFAVGLSFIKFIEEPNLSNAAISVVVAGTCLFFTIHKDCEVDSKSNDNDLEIAMLKSENAGLKAINSMSEVVIKSSDMVIKDLKKQQVERYENK